MMINFEVDGIYTRRNKSEELGFCLNGSSTAGVCLLLAVR